ncbi:PrgI family protein [Patescibacteria group bacterium]
MQFQVPQNIDMEDKIVGPLTLKNFLILIFGGMFIYVIFLLPIPRSISIIISIPLIFALIAITFIKVQDQSFSKFFVSLIYYWLRPKQRVWNQKQSKPTVNIKDKIKKPEHHISKQLPNKQSIEKLAEVVDTKGWKPIGQEEENSEQRIRSESSTDLPQKAIEPKNVEDILEKTD